MKSIEQIAQAAYQAFVKVHGLPVYAWKDLPHSHRKGWIAAAQAVREEIAAVH